MNPCKWQEVHSGATYTLEWCSRCGALRDYPDSKKEKITYDMPLLNDQVCKKVKQKVTRL